MVRDRLRDVGHTSLTIAAEIANVSPRTVQRQLGDEGLTFQRLVDRVRFQLASEMLENPNVTALDVTESPGRAAKKHFLRAFRRFTGMTPSEYRRCRLEDDTPPDRTHA